VSTFLLQVQRKEEGGEEEGMKKRRKGEGKRGEFEKWRGEEVERNDAGKNGEHFGGEGYINVRNVFNVGVSNWRKMIVYQYCFVVLIVLLTAFPLPKACRASESSAGSNPQRVSASAYGIDGKELDAVGRDTVSAATRARWQAVISTLPYAELVRTVYGDNDMTAKDKEKTPAGTATWEFLNEERNPLTGFHAATYRNSSTNQVVVVFDGRKGYSNSDRRESMLINTYGYITPKHKEARDYAIRIMETYGDRIEFAGHAFGGGLAQYVAISLEKRAVSFNAIGYDLFNKLVFVCAADQKLTNVFMHGDPYRSLKTFGESMGIYYGNSAYELHFRVPGMDYLSVSSMGAILDRIRAMKSFRDDRMMDGSGGIWVAKKVQEVPAVENSADSLKDKPKQTGTTSGTAAVPSSASGQKEQADAALSGSKQSMNRKPETTSKMEKSKNKATRSSGKQDKNKTSGKDSTAEKTPALPAAASAAVKPDTASVPAMAKADSVKTADSK
jgi:hypothetical protein